MHDLRQPLLRDVTLGQRGRSALDFAGTLARKTNALNKQVEHTIRASVSNEAIADDCDTRLTQIGALLESNQVHAIATMSGDWLSRQHGEICRDAFEEVADQYTPLLDALDAGPTTLNVASDFVLPAYFTKQWFHNTSGGWDGHRYMGAIQAEFVHRRYVAAKYGSGLRQLRLDLLDQLPDVRFDSILEMGTSAGYFTEQLATRFPDAQLVGCDLSLRMLEQARRLGNEQGHAWQLWQAAAEDTGLAGDSFDLVTSYAMFHEIPTQVAANVWREAMRVVKPGGWVLMADGVPELSAIDKVAGWRFLFGWARGGEPYAREYCSAQDSELATAAGFIDVREGLLSDRPFPRFTLARKPLEDIPT